MHDIFYTFFIALSNNFDNIGVRIAYSIRGIKISTLINLWISVITFFISYFAAYSGSMITGFFGKHLSSIIAMLLLSAIGLWMILEQYIRRVKNDPAEEPDQENASNILHVLVKPENADMDRSKHIDFKEATILGIALSINNVGGGLSAGMMGLSSLLVGFLSAVISFIALWSGNYIAEYFIKWNINKKATVVAGLALIAIGIEQVL
ncbi:MAG: sporulation membrane protein YtaF [Dissulfurispiraceae bacterium]